MAHKITYLMHRLVKDSREGSYSTQANRSDILQQAVKRLKADGYRLETPKSLKPKHVVHLVKTWQDQGLSPGTIKNRMAHMRWWAEKVGKAAIIPRSNSGQNDLIKLDIEKRSLIPSESKAKVLDGDALGKVENRLVEASLRLQGAFGLRREESIKVRPEMAHRGNFLVIKDTWAKGKRGRVIEIRTSKQREALAFAKMVAQGGSLIPADKKYVDQLHVYNSQLASAGINNAHGFRHHYAQQRYTELTGNEAPVNGGVRRSDMSPEGKQAYDAARLLVSQELGHERMQVVAQYIGS